MKKIVHLTLILGVTAALSACANMDGRQSNAGGLEIHDPFEEVNRSVFAFNNAVDDAVIHPLVDGYRYAVPDPARSGIRNFLRNLKSPVRLANQLLQGDADGAGNEIVRTVVNTFVGVGGLFDVAGYEGLKHEHEDFGQTLGVWGVDQGPYVVVPFLGPATMRDGAGYIVDSLADPLRWYLYNIDEEGWYYAKVGADYFDLRVSLVDVLRDLEASSIDYYAAVRSTYYQNREALVQDRNGQGFIAAPAQPVEDGYGWDDI